MYIQAELVLKSYLPEKLEIGMYFYRVLKIGVNGAVREVWQLMELPSNDQTFLMWNGAPVELYILAGEMDILAMPSEIGWFDAGEDTDELYDITLDEINTIIHTYNGLLEIQIDEEDEEELSPLYIDNKVIIKYTE